MAYGHCTSSWCVALMLINALSLFTDRTEFTAAAALLLAIGIAGTMAGVGIANDWDHPNSTVTTMYGPLSHIIHQLVLELHYTVCALTIHGGDRKPPGPHRGVTHWWPFPIVVGALVAAGCWCSKWALFGVLVVLYSAAIRGLTIPDYMPRQKDTVRHRWGMLSAHGILDLIPFMVVLKRSRKYVNATERIGGYWLFVRIPVGKIATVLLAADFALIAIRSTWIVSHGAWLGAIVCIGMWIHIIGDSPTEMGIPGWKLNRLWRLPKWLAFRAGGPFELVFCWIPMTALGIYLLPGFRPHAEVMAVQWYICCGLGTLAIAAIVIEAISRKHRQRVWGR